MKLPSLVRLPKYKRFNLEPRYYDAIKEEMRERTERIKREMEMKENPETRAEGMRSSIGHAFARRSAREQGASTLQLLLMFFLLVGVFGYIYWGNIALYSLAALAVPAYLYYRFKGRMKD